MKLVTKYVCQQYENYSNIAKYKSKTLLYAAVNGLLVVGHFVLCT